MALRVGLTGGIASGKSTVAQHFVALGVAVIDADQVARELLVPGMPLLAAVLARFGPQVSARYGSSLRRADGSLERRLLRRLVFEDAGERRALEALTHPAIRARTEQLALQVGGVYQIHVNPLLVETHSKSRYDRVLVVDCPQALQFARLQARDGMDLKEAQAMLAAQADRTARLAIADDVIVNEGAPEALAPRVAALHSKYLAQSAAT